MKLSDLTIMLRFSASPLVTGSSSDLQADSARVRHAQWYERRGGTELYISEHWSPLAPDIWLVTSKKK